MAESLPGAGHLGLALHRLRRRTWVPRWGWWACGLTLLGVGVLTQWVSAYALRWPDGSMAGYGLLLLTMALALIVCVRKTSSSH